jgi:diketogulonate reductase-like aldo/keto reductase
MLTVHVLLQDKLKAVAAAGYTSFDTADIYGPSEGVHPTHVAIQLTQPTQQLSL